MNQNDFDRLNTLSEKALSDNITAKELNEFRFLINDWNTSFELSLLSGLCDPKIEIDEVTNLKVGDVFR